MTLKSKKLADIWKYFCQIQVTDKQAIEKTITFSTLVCRILAAADLGAIFLSKRDSSFLKFAFEVREIRWSPMIEF